MRKSASPNENNLSFLEANFPAPPRAPHPPLGSSRKKHVSPCATCSHVPRLESRIEALERENKLLEAALIGILKTSGTLNRCPCVILSKSQETGGGRVGVYVE
jgi:hypothetical protein